MQNLFNKSRFKPFIELSNFHTVRDKFSTHLSLANFKIQTLNFFCIFFLNIYVVTYMYSFDIVSTVIFTDVNFIPLNIWKIYFRADSSRFSTCTACEI